MLKFRVEGYLGDNIVVWVGDIKFILNDVCIVDFRIGLFNEVLGCFGEKNFYLGWEIKWFCF